MRNKSIALQTIEMIEGKLIYVLNEKIKQVKVFVFVSEEDFYII